jgi:NAD(P)-dependent dehydrogenase (short-subunit alcohol dehydrogenase family)
MKIESGMVAVITGGASGIGLELARALGSRGCRIVIADIEAGALEDALGSLPEGTLAVRTDVSRAEDVSALAQATLDRFGQVDIVCNNAGVSTFNTIENQTLEDWRWVIDVNLWGAIHGVNAFLPILRRQGTPGYFVNTASVAGILSGIAYIGPYAVSKVGIVSLSETLHMEMQMIGAPIGVSVLCPGATNTGVMESERNRPDAPEQRTPDAEQMRLFIRSQFTGPTGLEPSVTAARVVDAIEHDQFWIITHDEFRETIESRAADILQAMPHS